MADKAITRRVNLYLEEQGVERKIKNIAAEYKTLQNRIAKMEIGSKEYIKTASRISDLKATLRDHNKLLYGTQQAWTASRLSVGNFIGFMGAAATARTLIQAGTQLFNIASNMELAGQKAETVYGPALRKVTKAAEENARVMGLTNAQYVEMATNIGDLLIPMEFTRDQAADISVELVNLSGALSEWTSGQISAESVTRILSKAMLGEREELKQLGISISENDVKARLAEKGLENLTDEMLQQAKAAATLELITERSADAQTAFAESTGSLVRSKAQLIARTTEIAERLAVVLIPVFENLVIVADAVVQGLEEMSSLFAGLSKRAQSANDAYYDQVNAVNELDSTLLPLLSRYDELQNKTNKNEAEQEELKKVMNDISEIVPKATTEVDNYGNALAISTSISKEFYEQQKENIELYKEAAKDTLNAQLDELEATQKKLRQQIETKKDGFASFFGLELSDDALRRKKLRLGEVTQELAKVQKQLDNLYRDPNQVQSESSQASTFSRSPIVPPKTTLDSSEEELKSHLDRINKFIQDAEKAKTAFYQSEYQNQLQAIRDKYQVELDLLDKEEGDQTSVRLDLIRLREQEIDRLNLEVEARRMEDTAEFYEEDVDAYFEKEYRKVEIQNEINNLLLSDQERELESVRVLYEALIAEAEKYEIDTTALVKKYQAEQDEIKQKFSDDQTKRLEAEINQYEELFGNLGTVFTNFGELVAKNERDQLNIKRIAGLADIAFSTGVAIANMVKLASSSSATPIDYAIQLAAGLSSVLGAIAKAKAAFNEAPDLPQRRHGGWFSATGQDDGITYNAQYLGRTSTGMLPNHPSLVLAGEGGREYFVSNDALNNPAVANYVAMIDAIVKNRVPQFRDGGFTQEPSFSPASVTTSADSRVMSKMLIVLERLLTEGVRTELSDEQLVRQFSRLKQLDRDSGGVILG